MKQRITHQRLYCYVLISLLSIILTGCSKELNPELVAMGFGGSNASLPDKVITAQKFDAYPAANRTQLFHEDFNNNANGWAIVAPNSGISNGSFWSNGRNVLYAKALTIDETKDFEIDTHIGFRNPQSPNFNGLMWSYNATSKKYWGIFNVQDPNNINQNIAFCAAFTNGATDLQTASIALDYYGSDNLALHKYTMRKVGDYIITFIDAIWVSTKKYIPIQGTYIGINDIGGIVIDNIYIDYLK